jgi:CubicO group peptidase (beta-lactamase class C family)
MADEVFPGAATALGDKNGELWSGAYGYRSLLPAKEALNADTVFDVASITKIMSTTIVALKLIDAGKLNLHDTLNKFFDAPHDKKDIDIKQIMTHTSGIPAHAMLCDTVEKPGDVYAAILGLNLLDPPGRNVVYSCLGFILLGKICETLGKKGLDRLAEEWVFGPLKMASTGYNPSHNHNNFAATEFCKERGEWLCGTVHDENARFAGGVSGNAGVFSTIADCSKFAAALAARCNKLCSPELFGEAVKNHTAHCGEGRGLGFVVVGDGARDAPTSYGTVFPPGTYGHTGFTGTSMWVDPETTQYAVLLTNRVHPTRDNPRMIPFRSAFHDLCAKEYRKCFCT